MSDTIYVPGSSAKKRTTTFGDVINLSFKAEELGAFVKQYKNEKGYINLQIVPRKTESQYGDTHSVKLDTWVPKEKDASASTSAPAGKPAGKAAAKTPPADPLDAPDDIPF